MKIIDSGTAAASANMERDGALLAALGTSQEAVLHFYEWRRPSATYGYFADPSRFLLPDAPLDIAKRPTGGGIIFHLTDFAFSLLVPATAPSFSLNTMANYRRVHDQVARALAGYNPFMRTTLLAEAPPSAEGCCGFCMAQPTQYDVMADGKKCAGGAQRRTRHGFLHQGSICLTVPDDAMGKALFRPGTGIPEAMQRNSAPVLAAGDTPATAKDKLKRHLAAAFDGFERL